MTAAGKLAGSALDLVVVVTGAVALVVVIQAFLIKPYLIPTASMLPTIHINQHVLVNRLGSDFSKPSVGDIVVFHPPRDPALCADPHQGANVAGTARAAACAVAQAKPSSQTFIKRVVGLPGDRISVRNGHVVRNGVAERDRYIAACDDQYACNFPATVTVPRGDYYMMGDNRPDSEDSRYWGPVPKAWIIGKAFFTYWPPDRVGFL